MFKKVNRVGVLPESTTSVVPHKPSESYRIQKKRESVDVHNLLKGSAAASALYSNPVIESLNRNIKALTAINKQQVEQIRILEEKPRMLYNENKSNNSYEAQQDYQKSLHQIELTKLQSDLEEKTKTLDITQNDIKELKRNNQILAEKTKSTERSAASERALIAPMKRELQMFREANKMLKIQIKTDSDNKIQIKSLQQTNEELLERIETLSKNYDKLQSEYGVIEKELEAERAAVLQKTSDFEIERQEWQDNSSANDEKVKTITIALEESRINEAKGSAQLLSQIKSLKDEVKIQEADKLNLRQMNGKMHQDVTEMSSKIELLRLELSNEKDLCHKNENSACALTAQVAELEVELEDAKKAAESRAARDQSSKDVTVEALRKARTGQNEALAILIKEKAEVHKKYSEVSSELEDKKSEILALEKTVEEQKALHEKSVIDFKLRSSDYETQLSSFKISISELRTTITRLENNNKRQKTLTEEVKQESLSFEREKDLLKYELLLLRDQK